jgi:hypothetical protein
MKIAIATPEQVGLDWLPFRTDFMHPFNIRAEIKRLLEVEGETREEIKLVCMNRTVLDLVGWSEAKNTPLLSYEDVVVWDGEKLVPLLDLHDEHWLAHFTLGDLFDRGHLDGHPQDPTGGEAP